MLRYQVRWSNGFWKTFDSVRFNDVEKHVTKAEAKATVERMNRSVRRV